MTDLLKVVLDNMVRCGVLKQRSPEAGEATSYEPGENMDEVVATKCESCTDPICKSQIEYLENDLL